MSQQTPYPPQAGYEQPYGGPPVGYAPQKTNTMAILGLVFAFVFSPLGIVFSAVGLSQIKQRREGGRGLAITGLVLSIVFLLISIAFVGLVVAAVDEAAEAEAIAAAPLEEPVVEEPAANLGGVAGACEVIMATMINMEADMAAITTPQEFDAAVAQVRSTLESAAAATSDAAFMADVQLVSDGLQETADVVAAGEDPAYLEATLAEDSAQVGASCALAGWTE